MRKSTQKPDMIAQVGEMLNRLANGECATGRKPMGYTAASDHTVLVGAAILAVAAELRDIANELRTLNGFVAAADARDCDIVAAGIEQQP